MLSPINLPSLEVLHLIDIQMEDLVLLNFMVGCPSLANLHIDCCSGLLHPQVLSLSLKAVEFRTGGWFCHCQTIKVHSPKLDSFVFDGRHGGHKCNINLAPCGTIRNVSFTNACFECPRVG